MQRYWRRMSYSGKTPRPLGRMRATKRCDCAPPSSRQVASKSTVLFEWPAPCGMLSADSAPFEFAGDDPAHGAPLDGPVVDLNVMARRGSFNARVQRVQAGAALEISPYTTVLFALGVLTVAAGRRAWVLTRGDALRFLGPGDCRLESSQNAAAYRIEISPATALRSLG